MSKMIYAFDFGSNSIGWSVFRADEKGLASGIVDMGSRIFPKGVEGGKPTPKNKKRRDNRLQRRVTQRRAARRKKLKNYLISLGFLPDNLKNDHAPEVILNEIGDPYVLRAKALDHDLTRHELGRVILHLSRRGFLSNKKTLIGSDMLNDPDVIAVLGNESTEDKETTSDKEESIFHAEISSLRSKIGQNKCRTLGEYLASKTFHERQRNRTGESLRTDRRMYLDELALIFSRQSQCWPELTEEIQTNIEQIIFFQRPIRLKEDRVGRCSLEPRKKRAAMARLEYQRFRYLQDINNLQHFCDDTEQWLSLNDVDKVTLKALFETYKERTFPQIRKALLLKPKTKFNLDTGVKSLKGNRTSVAIAGVFAGWAELPEEGQAQFVEDLLSIKKKSALKTRLVNHWGVDGETAVRLCMLEFESGHGMLSLKAINNLMPHLEKGMIYSDARVAAGYGYEIEEVESVAKLGAPPEVPNPIVSRALHELRRVVNAMIAEYGKPDVIRIEMARDLEMNTKKHARFMKQQKENTKRNRKADEEYRKVQTGTGRSLSAKKHDRIKYRLWEDQRCCCIYSGKTISMKALFSAEIEIDHILPFELTANDSYMNKVVCLASENQAKGRRTPKDAFGGNDDKWHQITQAINKLPKGQPNKVKAFYETEAALLDRDFISNQLNDTRYISTVAGDYLKTLGADITFTKGIMTSWLRQQWKLNDLLGKEVKNRDDHRHHAIDAAITACIDRRLYQTLINTSKDLSHSGSAITMNDIYLDPPIDNIKEEFKALLDNMIVSRSPLKKIAGALHKTTGIGYQEGIGGIYRKDLNGEFTAKKAENILDPVVKKRVVAHLAQHHNDPKKAFCDGFSLVHQDGKTKIKRVRIRQSDNPNKAKFEENKLGVKDTTGKIFKWMIYGNIHHTEILKNTKTGKYEAFPITVYEVASRIRGVGQPKTPAVKKDHGDDWSLYMVLYRDSLVSLVISGERVIYRVEKMPELGSKTIPLRLNIASTQSDKEQSLKANFNTLINDYKLELLSVNVLGVINGD